MPSGPAKIVDRDGYVDLQVNGYAGVDFNSENLDIEALRTICQRLREEGAAGFLPTLITAEIDTMVSRIKRLVDACQADSLIAEMVWGFHLEGPFISDVTGYVGAHDPSCVRRPNIADTERLLEAANGMTRIVTLAPEHDEGFQVTRFLADQGITVSAGHCNPSLEQLQAAIDAGLSMFTHLGNGCTRELVRHDNIIQHVLSLSKHLWICFIADGLHVPFPALGNYLRAAGLDRCVVVSDAVSAAGLGPGTFTLCGQTVVVGDDLVPRSTTGSNFVGSATMIPQMAERLRQHLQLSEDEVAQLTIHNPRRILMPG